MTQSAEPLVRVSSEGDMLKMIRHGKLELGLGMPPDAFSCSPDEALAGQIWNPQSKLVIVEVARWKVDLPVTDAAIAGTFGSKWNVWGVTDGQPPLGVTAATNTLATPGVLAQDMILQGLSVRVLVEPEARTIRGNVVLGASTNMPGSPDVWDLNDSTGAGNPLNLATGQTMLPAELLWGLPTWKAAYAFVNGMELQWTKNHQDALIKEPLTQMANIQPFAEAEAAGNAFASNIDRIFAFNDRLGNILGIANTTFTPVTHRRLLSSTIAAANTGNFTPTREDDASPTVFGGIGVTPNGFQRDPWVFATPMYWPAGHTMGMLFVAHDQSELAQCQRWMSLTGGNGGNPGFDLSMPITPVAGQPSGTSPTLTGARVMVEPTIDTVQAFVTQQVVTNRFLGKGGRLVIEIGLLGRRIPESWKGVIYKHVVSGAIQAPAGFGSLRAYKDQAA